MEKIMPFIESSQNEWILILVITCIVLFVLLFITMINLSFFISKYKKVLKETKGVQFDDYIVKSRAELTAINQSLESIQAALGNMNQRIQNSYSKLYLKKYNAFENQGGKLSYVLLLLDSHNDGIMLNNVHNNSFTYQYIKRVQNGTTEEQLIPEEQELIRQALNGDGGIERGRNKNV